MNKKVKLFSMYFVVLFVSSAIAVGAASITPERVVDHVKKAVQLVINEGETEAFKKLTDPNGAWVDGDLYVFVYDFDGNIVAHLNKKLEGKNLLKIKDTKGNVFAAEFIRIAKTPAGEGWCEYWWPKPGEKKASPKTSFIKRVPGKELLIGVGTYEFNIDDV